MKFKFILLFAVSTLLISCGKAKEEIVESAAMVETIRLAPKDFVLSYKGPASLEGWKVSDLGVEQNGRIKWIGVEEGDRVKAGQILFKIYSDVQSARSLESSARISDAKVSMKNAEDNYSRVKKLFDQGVASQQELENALALRDRTAEAVSAARAGFAASAGDLGKTIVRAPFDGIITRKNYEVGEVVGNNSTVLRVEEISSLKAVVKVPEREIFGIEPGANAILSLASGATCSGTVALVSPAADEMSRTVRAEIRFDSYPSQFRSGLFCDAEIIREVRKNALLVPRSALVQKFDGTAVVYVVEGGVAKKRKVKIGGSDDYLFEIVEGLKSEDEVITSGVARLADGMKVESAAKSSSLEPSSDSNPAK